MAEARGVQVVEIGKEVWQEVQDDDLLGLAAEVAYNLLLALFPTLIFLAALAGFIGSSVGVGDLFNRIVGYLAQVLPPSALETVMTPLEQVLSTESGGLLSFGILGTLWAASNATATMMKAFNREYGVKETRPFWKHRLLIAVGLTVLLALLIVSAFLLFIFGEGLGRWVAGFVGAGDLFVTVWTILRWPVILLALLLGLAVLYWLGPNVKQSFRWISPGSVLATLLWLLFTYLFQLYIANFGNYDKTYGTIAGVIVLMLWLYLTCFLVLLGAEINSEAEHQTAHDTTEGPPQPMGQRNATMADELPDPPVPSKKEKNPTRKADA